MKLHQDIWIGSLILAFCGYFYNEATLLDEGSEVMPMILLTIMAALGALVLLGGILKTKRATAENPVKPFLTFAKLKIPFSMFFLVVAYIIGFHFVGYYIATALFTIISMRFLKLKSWTLILIISTCFIAFTYFFLVKQLNVSVDELGMLGLYLQQAKQVQ